MNIAVYAIAKNEEKFVDAFMASVRDADGVYVLDTGSTDNTVDKLRKSGAIVEVKKIEWSDWPEKSRTAYEGKLKSPWRFDIPRNWSLKMIPRNYDVCVCLDLDEIMRPGWRKCLESQWTKNTTRLRYRYIWNHLPDGTPDVEYFADKIHSRNFYKWTHPVHEVLCNFAGNEVQTWCDLVIEHFADVSKSRSSYLPLLELAVWERPDDDRNSHYLGREYTNIGMWDKGYKELRRHLSLPSAVWNAERSASMRYLSKCCLNLGKHEERLAWLRRACAEAPGEREPWLELAQLLLDKKDYLGGYYAAKQALNITERPPTYITNAFAWGNRPYDIAGTCASYLGLIKESRELTRKALDMDPTNRRIIANMKFVNRESKCAEEAVRTNIYIIGKINDRDKNNLLLSAGKPENIQFFNYNDQRLSVVSPGDIVVFLSDCENFGLFDNWDIDFYTAFTGFDGYIDFGGILIVDYYSFLHTKHVTSYNEVMSVLNSNDSLECKHVL